MARSLMELYGGGMVYPANNYQLGGLIAGARRGREYQGEMRQLKEQQEKIAKEQQRAGMWGSILGTVGSIAGTALAGPAGTAVGAGIGGGLGRFLGEKQYKTTKIGEGKYRKQTRKDIGEAQKEFKAGRGERALVSGLQSALMSKAFAEIGKGIGKGVESISTVGSDAEMMRMAMEGTGGATFEEAAKGVGRDPNWFLKSIVGAPKALPAVGAGAVSSFVEQPDFSVNVTGGQQPSFLAGIGEKLGVKKYASGELDNAPFGYNQNDVNVDPNIEYSETGRPIHTGYSGFSNIFGNIFGAQSGGLIDYMMPRRMQEGGYATATDPLQALEQMGFEGIADDPRLQEYMEDLPDWQQGYAQQVGNITTAGQQQMGQIGTQMRQQQAQAGFGGSGIGAGAAQQDRAGVGQEFQRGRRGIVAGFQADLLAGIRDIEAKGEFEFGSDGSIDAMSPGSYAGEYRTVDGVEYKWNGISWNPTVTGPTGQYAYGDKP